MSSKTIQSILAAAVLATTAGCRTAYEAATPQLRKWNQGVVEYELAQPLSEVVDEQFKAFTGNTIDFKKLRAKISHPEIPAVWVKSIEDKINAENVAIEKENLAIKERNSKLKNPLKREKLLELKPVEVTYDAFAEEFKTTVGEAHKAGQISQDAQLAAIELLEHTIESIALQKRFRIQRYMLSVGHDNTASELDVFTLGRLEHTKGGDAFRSEVKEWIEDYRKSIRDFEFKERQVLDETFRDEKLPEELRAGYEALFAFDQDSTKVIKQLFSVGDALASLEAHYHVKHRFQKAGSEINQSMTGRDQYKLGETVLETILNRLTIKDVARPGSQLHDTFEPETSLGDAYQSLLQEVREEAKDPAWHTRDKLAQGPIYMMVNALAQAGAGGYFQTKMEDGSIGSGNHLFVAARNKVIEDIVDATSTRQLQANPNYWHVLGDLFLPLYGAGRGLSNADWAFKSNWVDLETEEGKQALMTAIQKGYAKSNAIENFEYVVDDNTPARVAFITGALGTVAQGATALGIIYGSKSSSSSSSAPAPAPATTGASGGGTIFNPTGN